MIVFENAFDSKTKIFYRCLFLMAFIGLLIHYILVPRSRNETKKWFESKLSMIREKERIIKEKRSKFTQKLGRVTKYDSEKHKHHQLQGECLICMTDYKKNHELLQLPCHQSHYFHAICFVLHFRKTETGSCPMCR